MPTSDSGKAIASRNATTHGLFARDVVLPSLGEDPEGYRQIEAEWIQQLSPRNLLERHYVEKIAAASWRLRRLHRWQAQLFEDDSLTEDERLDRLDKVLRHETALHRQIDTSVKMLNKDVPQLYQRRVRDQVLEDTQISEREAQEDWEDNKSVDMQTRNRLYQIRKATQQAVDELSVAPLDAATEEKCENELPPPEEAGLPESVKGEDELSEREKCQNELSLIARDPCRVREFLDPDYRHRPLTFAPSHPLHPGKGRRSRRG